MCGIVGAIAERDVVPILVEGLRRLEYRGYDSAGVAALLSDGSLLRERVPGKVQQLADAIAATELAGRIGIAHTRWATHGEPSERNAHPHISRGNVALVHNGIIENHDALRKSQRECGYEFSSETDTEVIVHQVQHYLEQGNDLLSAVQHTIGDLEGAYGLGVICTREPQRLVAARRGSPLVVGIGIGEHFIASDVAALLPVTRRFIFLEDGDIVDLRRDSLTIYDDTGAVVERPIRESEISLDAVERGDYRHYMLKEIHEQPRAIADTLEGRIAGDLVLEESFGHRAGAVFDQVKRVTIIACGTSYHAGMVARYWLEGLVGLPCHVEVASEFRYRNPVVEEGTLLVMVSQSGETADTLAALEAMKARGGFHTLAICNVPESSLMRAAEINLLTRAGPEIGVASTKAFTTQLVALLMLTLVLGRRNGLPREQEQAIVRQLESLPRRIEQTINELEKPIQHLAEAFVDKHHALFLGRGAHYPIAMEGALKLKEISYIHAEAYPAGELKHGPLALVDEDMPVVTVAPHDTLVEKLKSNLQEVRARGGMLYVFTDGIPAEDDNRNGTATLHIEPVEGTVAPILFTVPLQLLAYYVAVLKGTDVDQPRNLAKSVTVE